MPRIQWIFLIVGGAVALAIIVIAILFYTRNQQDLIVVVTPTPPPVSPTPIPPIVTLPESWQTYTSERLKYSISYPEGMEIRQNQDGSTTFVELGPSQTEGTEIFDGISLTINGGSFSGDFQAFVESRRQTITSDPATDSVGEVEPITINNLQGYQFGIVGLGNFTYIYLPNSTNQYLEISVYVEDPTNAGFRQTVENMLTSLEF